MKNIKKASLLSVLSLAVAIPLTASAAATTEVTPATTDSAAVSQSANTSTDVNTPTAGNHVITPNATTPRIENRPISGTTYLADFDIKANYGYVRVYLKNTGSQRISFTINQGSPGGRQKASGSVGPGETYNEIVNGNSGPWAVGTFYVNLTSGSSNMSGQLGVRISTDLNF